MSFPEFLKKNTPKGRVFHLVFHPMILENQELAIKSIGGLKNFARTVQDRRSLLLKLQPDNEYHAGIYSDKPKGGKTCVHVVFKFQKNKRTGAVRVQCLGVAKNNFTFSSMADFQYLPITKMPTNDNCYQDLVPRIVPQNLTDALCWWDRPIVDDNLPFFLPPFSYSRYTKAINRLMTPEELSANADVNEMLAENRRAERKTFTLICSGDDEFPKEPTAETISEADQRCRSQHPHDLVNNLFERRAMWTRPAILAETGLDDALLKSLLPKYAFYIISGPFGRCWCKYGYDPRKDPTAKAYQTVAVSFRLNERIPERVRLKIAARMSSNQTATFFNSVKDKMEYRFIAGSLPHARQMWYCIIDVKLAVAEQVLQTDFLPIIPACHENTGWLPLEIVETVREAIKADVAQTMAVLRESQPDDFSEDLQYYEEGGIEDIF
uniref:General transcription factor 3C polypeptide 5 n=2 Tax=Panagrolaimus sp. JU765 TaxID=591449 RepID=A0AC34PYM6_9BILA